VEADMAALEARKLDMADIEGKFMATVVGMEETRPDSRIRNDEVTTSKNMMKARRMVVRLLQNPLLPLAHRRPQVSEPLHSIPSKEMLRSRRSLNRIFSTLETNQWGHQPRTAKLR
jgi:hypothetical protein